MKRIGKIRRPEQLQGRGCQKTIKPVKSVKSLKLPLPPKSRKVNLTNFTSNLL